MVKYEIEYAGGRKKKVKKQMVKDESESAEMWTDPWPCRLATRLWSSSEDISLLILTIASLEG